MKQSLCGALPRVNLADLPTPFEKMERMSERTGVNFWVKREDATGLAFGGNKIRNHEFIFGEMRAQGCDAVITTAGVQSNMCRATAAAASKLGMDCVLLLRGTGDEPEEGNLLLDRLLGADVRFIPTKDPYDERVPGWLDEVKEELEAAGKTPYVLHLTGETSTVAVCAYMSGAEELIEQMESEKIDPEWLFVTTGSGITAAGLALGLKHLKRRTKVVGVSSAATADFLTDRIVQYGNAAAEKLGIETRLTGEDVRVLDQYIGPGYGESYPEVEETIRMVAREEAVLLDPVYTGKCMVGVLDQVEKGMVSSGETVVFLHSGGGPNLFLRKAVR
jgi:D-cysteine desulfhydrase family pyridoxal phosphate-dependent enzyme